MSSSPVCADVPTRPEPVSFSSRGVWKLYLLIAIAVVFLARFLWWLIQPEHVGDSWLFAMLMVSIGYRVFFWLYEWYLYIGIAIPDRACTTRRWTVDVFTTACPGEPEDMIVRTLRAIVAITYPHNSYLCDEGNSPTLKRACRELGVIHVTRNERKDAKAGNINNALARSNGEICIVLDPDHVPQADFISRVLGYFEDPRVGFVQTVQAYANQSERLIARGGAEQSYMFYGPMMTGMNRWGTVQAIGANCVFRRQALASIGGHAVGLAEDMHTAMRLHARGWKGVYLPEILTRGEVPSTLAAYYKQQLKWSCGCFDLLFQQYSKLWSGFSTANKVHYFVSPLHYLRGFVNLFDFVIPILSLVLGAVVLSIRPEDFLVHYLPVLLAVQLLRWQAQHWLADPRSERGLYLMGGMLKTGTWWIYIVGTFCSVLRIKVPYIPTPKGEAATNAWILALPNFALAAVSLGAVAYGLDYDWSPYSLAMAGFALWNAVILIFCAMIGQQQFFRKVRTSLSPDLRKVSRALAKALSVLRPEPRFALLACTIALFPLLAILTANSGRTALVSSLDTGRAAAAPTRTSDLGATAPRSGVSPQATGKQRDTGPFLLGMYTPHTDAGHLPADFWNAGQQLGVSLRVVSLYQEWGPNSLKYFPDAVLKQTWQNGGVPMITWEPWTRDFPEFASDPDLSRDRKVFRAVVQGRFDRYLRAYSERLRDYHKPVLLRFAHEPDNPSYPWSTTGGNTPAEYVAAWRYVVNFFKSEGASNVAFVWNPWHPEAVMRYFPGAPYFDWFGLTLLNYGPAGLDRKWHRFEELYEPFRSQFVKLAIDKPTMLAEFGSVSYGGDAARWLGEAMDSVAERHPEIRGVVFFHSDMDRNWATPWRPPGNPHFIDWTFLNNQNALAALRPVLARSCFHDPRRFAADDYVADGTWPMRRSAPYIAGTAGHFALMVDGKPFYVQGVAYNVGQEWRDGYRPMTRRLIEEDFAKIKAMGANTVRRYGIEMADHNVLAAARDQGLKVLYGFWFEEDVDYVNDPEKLRQYEDQIRATVLKYKDDPSILGWSLGNEVWGLLKHRFAAPYLTQERIAYLNFIEESARTIHQLDPRHPVFMVSEHSWDLPGELFEAAHAVPSVDVLGINSYYDSYISQLDRVVKEYNWFRPYLVSEFGPSGYWDETYTKFDNFRVPVEPSDAAKAGSYAQQWRKYIAASQGDNVGGVAFTWRDRMEETFTWFGLSDYAGRLKPSYYALRAVWTGQPALPQPQLTEVKGPDEVKRGAVVDYAASMLRVVSIAGQGLKIHWDLRRDNIFETDARITPSEDGSRATVRLPNSPGDYRLYVYLLTPSNGVDTASLSIHVE